MQDYDTQWVKSSFANTCLRLKSDQSLMYLTGNFQTLV